MRVRAARPRRNVQQCEQELLHSAAPILSNTLHGLNPKNQSFRILLSSPAGSSEAVRKVGGTNPKGQTNPKSSQ